MAVLEGSIHLLVDTEQLHFDCHTLQLREDDWFKSKTAPDDDGTPLLCADARLLYTVRRQPLRGIDAVRIEIFEPPAGKRIARYSPPANIQ